MTRRIDFAAVKAAALAAADSLVTQWLPDGRREGAEWVAINPVRTDSRPGSFKINISSGIWADFATDDRGGDLISLLAYLRSCSQLEAATELADDLGVADAAGDARPAAGRPRSRQAGADGRPPSDRPPPPQQQRESGDDWRAIVPVPKSAPTAPSEHYRHKRPSRTWVYRSADGGVLCWVYRFDASNGKTIAPLTYCEREGVREWRWKALPAPRPLYNLDVLAQRPNDPVVICEGEKATEAATKLLPGYVCTCSLNGSKSARKTDWTPLEGRQVFIWPDYDDAGRDYMQEVSKLLQGVASSVEQIKIPLAGSPLPGGAIDPKSVVPPAGWDAADAVDDGWTSTHLERLKQVGILTAPLIRVQRARGGHGVVVTPDQLHREGETIGALSREEVPLHPDTGQPWPPIVGTWLVGNEGVQEPGKDANSAGSMICMRPVWVEACTWQPLGSRTSWGVFIKFFDLAWRLKGHAFPMRRLSEQGGVLGQELLDMGMPVVAGKEKMLCRYLGVQAQAAAHVRATSKLGWLDDNAEGPRVFVMPDQVIGNAEQIVYQPDAPNMEYLAATLHAKGTLDEWRDQVATPCIGNPVLMFMLMAGLAPPLMRFTETPSGGFHLAGGSTTGKTTALQVAVTPWGCGADPQSGPQHTAIRRWKATGNALEAVAEMHNHMLLALDEINEVDPRELGGIIYQLAGGQSKGRATLHGGLRAPRHWQILYVSSGERSIRDMLRQAGHTLQGGQQVRLPEIPAEDPRTGVNAIIETTGDLEPREFAESLKLACSRYYGSAGPVLVAYLIQQVTARGHLRWVAQLRDELRAIEDKLVERLESLQEALSPENRRALRQFALLALAGMHATQAGILPWSFNDSFEAIQTVVVRWVRDQGDERTEVERGIAHLRDQIVGRIGQFVSWATPQSQVTQREVLGFEKDDYFMVIPTAFRQMVAEFDTTSILRALDSKGFLKHNKGVLTMRSPAISALGDVRPHLYWIHRDFLEVKVEQETAGESPPRPMMQRPLDRDTPF